MIEEKKIREEKPANCTLATEPERLTGKADCKGRGGARVADHGGVHPLQSAGSPGLGGHDQLPGHHS
jgi:hypothetical protein